MPKKRKRTDKEDLDKIYHKIRRLERKLGLSRTRGDGEPSTSTASARSPSQSRISSPIQHTPEAVNEPEEILSPFHSEAMCPVTPEAVPEAVTEVPEAATELPKGVSTSEEPALDIELNEILGEDPSQITKYGKAIHTGLASRLEHILSNGLEAEARKELLKKYLTPENCPRMLAPCLNMEIKASMSDINIKRDKGIEARQKQIGVAVSCLSEIISQELELNDKNPSLLKKLMDLIKILCDSIHSDSAKRRYFAFSSLKKDMNEHLMNTKIDKYLFGENLSDTIKTAKAVSKSVADIRGPFNKARPFQNMTNQTVVRPQGNLNWRAPTQNRRPAGQQRSRQPAPTPPSTSTRSQQPLRNNNSRPYRYQQKNNRR